MDQLTPQKFPERTPQQRVEDKLDRIAEYLHHLDRRDRMRTITGMIQWSISLIPMILFLISLWYVYGVGQSLIQTMSPANAQKYFEQVQGYFKK